MERFVGYFDYIKYSNEESGFVIASFVPNDGDAFFAVGVYPLPTCHIEYELSGVWETHPKFGAQFKVQTMEFVLPESEKDILVFLSSGVVEGVGEATARLIVSVFGADSLEVIEKSPHKLQKLPGIGAKKMQRIHEGYMRVISMRKNLMFFYSIGISTNTAFKIMESLGPDAVGILTANPYILIERVRGFGFKKADAVAMQLGVKPDSKFRIRACILSSMNDDIASGHTYSLKDGLMSVCGNHGIERDAAEAVLYDMVLGGVVILPAEGRVAYRSIDETETAIAAKLLALAENANPLRRDPDFLQDFASMRGIGFDEKQKEAIEFVFSEGCYIITGGPGTGKTTIINAIINAFEKQGREALLCAPTGRAAKKLADATGRQARTIHRLLGSNGEFFAKNAEEPLECDAVIVDEVSMVDIFLMNSLLSALRPGTALILVGDKDQLPSVGAGSVLRDILRSGALKTVGLTRIFRQSGDSMISVNASRIINGELPEKGRDFYIFGGSGNLCERTVKLVTEEIPKHFGFDPKSEVQVLSVKYDGVAGVNELNNKLKTALNPETGDNRTKKVGGRSFSVGDKVMQTSNNYDIEWTDALGDSGKGVFNGDIGTITEIAVDDAVVRVEFDDGRLAEYDFSDVPELTHAYAITVHKSQGSEYPCVVMPIYSAYTMENRNILYTAVTRAKRLVVLLGDLGVLGRFVRRVSIDDRRSTLAEKLVLLCGAAPIDGGEGAALFEDDGYFPDIDPDFFIE